MSTRKTQTAKAAQTSQGNVPGGAMVYCISSAASDVYKRQLRNSTPYSAAKSPRRLKTSAVKFRCCGA